LGRTLTRGSVLLLIVGALGFALVHPLTSRADSLPCQAPNRGFDFDTLELEQYQTGYATAIELAAAGKALPAPYTLSTGERVDASYPGLETGPRTARTAATTAQRVPPTVFKAIAWIESNWANGSNSVPYGGVGPLLVSGDCGYGIAQVTSGMGHLGSDALEPGVPSAQQAIIGTDFIYNIAEGVRLLAGKWNLAPSLRPIAGNGDPAMLEDWYYAIWSYNGFAFSNHPLNPNLDPLRGGGTSSPVFHCNDPAAPGYQVVGGSQKYSPGSYTYPERVYGCMRYPPKIAGGGATASANTPKFVIGDKAIVFGTAGEGLVVHQAPGAASPRIVPAPGGVIPDGTPVTITGGPQVSGDYTWWRATTPIGEGWMAEDFLSKQLVPPPVDPANRMWPPQVFNMPDLALDAVASAFKPAVFLACDNADSQDFAGGCPGMDFPTTIPASNVAPHPDTTPPVDPSLAAAFIGDPRLQTTGPTTASLETNSSGATSVTITVSNVGTWLAPFRIRTSANWIVVHHANDPVARTLDGGVAIGSETDVVLQRGGVTTPRIAQKGYQSVLTVTLDQASMPGGTSTGTVLIEPLLGSGSTFTLTVTGKNNGVPATPTRPPIPTPTPQVFQAVAPGVSRDR
jgi:hypothetical protein